MHSATCGNLHIIVFIISRNGNFVDYVITLALTLFSCQFSINCAISQFSPKLQFALEVIVGILRRSATDMLHIHRFLYNLILINDAEPCISELLCLLAVLVYAAEEHSVMDHAVVSTAILYATSKWSK